MYKERIIRKYFQGWLSAEKAKKEPTYWPHWQKTIEDLESEDFEAVVFKIPRRLQIEVLEEVERLFQFYLDK